PSLFADGDAAPGGFPVVVDQLSSQNGNYENGERLFIFDPAPRSRTLRFVDARLGLPPQEPVLMRRSAWNPIGTLLLTEPRRLTGATPEYQVVSADGGNVFDPITKPLTADVGWFDDDSIFFMTSYPGH